MSTDHRSKVANTALALLQDKSREAFGDVSCQYDEGTIILRGRSASYYDKQVAQETVRRVDGVMQVVNEIEVRPSSISTSKKRALSQPLQVVRRRFSIGMPGFDVVFTGARKQSGYAAAVDVCIENECSSPYDNKIGSTNGTFWKR